mmetsp:Transcript_58405/g.166248  ORF Transcript_58405/g.166248 Transcript_58405/m.166248 type:complete len:201 (+) Transcript_58405:958-1560(+)
MSFSERKPSRQKTRACRLRKAMSRRQKRRSLLSCPEQPSQENQLSESWHQPLLQPCCVRPYSSPNTIIGVPMLRNRAAKKLRICLSRSALMLPSPVFPSWPQFQELLWSSPLFSPLQRLCFSLYETRSYKVKPSCAVMKLMEWNGLLPSCLYRSLLPHIRVANSLFMHGSPFMKRRTVSRQTPFHSAQRVVPHEGNLPTR